MNTFDYLRQSFFFFRQNLAQIAAIQLPFLIPLNGLMLWLDINSDPASPAFSQHALLLSLLSLLVLPVYWAATIYYMQSRLDDQPLRAGQAILKGLTRWRTLLVIFILSGLAIASGLFLLIIPGIYIGVRLAFADYIGVLTPTSALSSLKQSWQQTDDYFWVLLQGLLILYPALQLVEFPISHYFASQEHRQLWLELPISVAIDLCSALITVYGFRVYCVMRADQPRKPEEAVD